MTTTDYSMARWRGKNALVTGASSGIGRAAAGFLAASGVNVAIAARRRSRLEALQAELAGCGVEILVITADLTSDAETLGMFETIRSQWGGIDILINNAGFGLREKLAEGSLEKWRALIDINVISATICMREAVQDIRRRASAGQIITISSVAGQRVPIGKQMSMYSAAKHAISVLTKGLWGELAADDSPIKIGLISPGRVETEWLGITIGDEQKARQLYAQQRGLSTGDIVEAMRFMLSSPPNVQINEITLRGIAQKE